MQTRTCVRFVKDMTGDPCQFEQVHRQPGFLVYLSHHAIVWVLTPIEATARECP
jgi:hypothetical protein